MAALCRVFSCGSADCSDDEPELLDSDADRRESVMLFEQLSSVQAPHVVTATDATTINFNATQREPPLDRQVSGFARVKSRSVVQGQGLEWTESRKLLEAAIVFEQSAPTIHPALTNRQDMLAQEQRLQARLWSLGLGAVMVRGDGNCQFSSLSCGLFGRPDHHRVVRKAVVRELHRRRGHYVNFLGPEFDYYVREMSKVGVWGDELTLRAACEAYSVVVNVVTSADPQDIWFHRYVPDEGEVKRELFLCYIAPVHYDAIRKLPRGAAPILRSMSSLGRRNSRIVATLDEFERTRAVPREPSDVLAGG